MYLTYLIIEVRLLQVIKIVIVLSIDFVWSDWECGSSQLNPEPDIQLNITKLII